MTNNNLITTVFYTVLAKHIILVKLFICRKKIHYVSLSWSFQKYSETKCLPKLTLLIFHWHNLSCVCVFSKYISLYRVSSVAYRCSVPKSRTSEHINNKQPITVNQCASARSDSDRENDSSVDETAAETLASVDTMQNKIKININTIRKSCSFEKKQCFRQCFPTSKAQPCHISSLVHGKEKCILLIPRYHWHHVLQIT